MAALQLMSAAVVLVQLESWSGHVELLRVQGGRPARDEYVELVLWRLRRYSDSCALGSRVAVANRSLPLIRHDAPVRFRRLPQGLYCVTLTPATRAATPEIRSPVALLTGQAPKDRCCEHGPGQSLRWSMEPDGRTLGASMRVNSSEPACRLFMARLFQGSCDRLAGRPPLVARYQVHERSLRSVSLCATEGIELTDVCAILYANMKAPRLPTCSGGCVKTLTHFEQPFRFRPVQPASRCCIATSDVLLLSGACYPWPCRGLQVVQNSVFYVHHLKPELRYCLTVSAGCTHCATPCSVLESKTVGAGVPSAGDDALPESNGADLARGAAETPGLDPVLAVLGVGSVIFLLAWAFHLYRRLPPRRALRKKSRLAPV
ncbi:uncharacterized protein LOC144161517 [Haemaphysalis longicornis]